MREADSKRLVIDADVLRASGGEKATDPRAKGCRDFLQEVLSLCHRVVMTPEIGKEWRKHRSDFVREWRFSMEARKKVCRVEPPANEVLLSKIKETATNKKACEDIRKDFHLLEAALETDRTIISLDETVRQHFTQAAPSVGEIRDTVWVNPERTKERSLPWLRDGAQPEEHRKLRNQS